MYCIISVFIYIAYTHRILLLHVDSYWCVPKDNEFRCLANGRSIKVGVELSGTIASHKTLTLVVGMTMITWSGLNFKANAEVVLFKWENLIKTIWWLFVTFISWGNHLGSLSYRQLVSMSCGMQLFHLVLHPPWSIDHLPNIKIHCLSEHIDF
jgi:hypothetical protein